jgi:excinuclease ABC subunit C
MIDANSNLAYVGKAKNLRARLLSYFRPRSRDPKAGAIVREARLLAWEVAPSEFAALLRELELIRRWQPRFNVQGQPRRRRRVYVCLGRRPAPYVFLAVKPPATAHAIYGPIPSGDTARSAVRRLNDWYRLRDCPRAQTMTFADQRELFPLALAPGCLRAEIESCLAPCAAGCSRDDYATQVRAARAFLDGTDATLLVALERDMRGAATEMQFERAAVLRDRWEALHWLNRHLERLREAMAYSFVYPVTGHDGTQLWYLIRRGRVVAALPRMTDCKQTAAMLRAVSTGGGVVPGPLNSSEVDGVLLVAAWFRRHPQEKHRVLMQAW